MNWGFKIILLYAGFVLLILSMVGLSMREKVDLVSKDYYEQELHFQDKINKVNNTNSLKNPLSWEIRPGILVLKFPEQFKGEKISGSIYFFRPSDTQMDKTVLIPDDTLGIRNISTSQLKRGMYKMQLSWKVNEVEYYNEGIIHIN